MTKDKTAQATATEPPPLPRACATDSCTWASQPGSPLTAPPIAPEMLWPARLAGSSQRTPMPLQTIAHTAWPPRAPSGPSTVAGPANTGPSAVRAVRGHTRSPMAT